MNNYSTGIANLYRGIFGVGETTPSGEKKLDPINIGIIIGVIVLVGVLVYILFIRKKKKGTRGLDGRRRKRRRGRARGTEGLGQSAIRMGAKDIMKMLPGKIQITKALPGGATSISTVPVGANDVLSLDKNKLLLTRGETTRAAPKRTGANGLGCGNGTGSTKAKPKGTGNAKTKPKTKRVI
jgi:hypothetical protein